MGEFVAGRFKRACRLADLLNVFGAAVASFKVRIELLLPVGRKRPIQRVGDDLDQVLAGKLVASLALLARGPHGKMAMPAD
jgi:hypothetical protein